MQSDQIYDGVSSELQLMLACAGHDKAHSRLEEIIGLLSKSIDWGLFLKLAHHHRVDPLVYKGLVHLPDGMIPEFAVKTLRERYKKNAIQALRMAGETARLSASFTEHGIRHVILKGPPLAQALYGDVALRPSHDIDLLVWPEDLATASAVLEKTGYLRIHPDYPLTPRRLQLYITLAHHFSYLHPGTGVLVELHWRLGHCGIELPLPQPDQITISKLAGRDVPVLMAEYGLLFLILHGASHGWFRLRWLMDIGRLLERELDWEWMTEAARKLGIKVHLYQALILADQLLAAPLPSRLIPLLGEDQTAQRLAKMAFSFIEKSDYDPFELSRSSDMALYLLQKKYNYQVCVGWKNKLKYVGIHLKPTEEDIQRVALPDYLFPAYYIIRPFTWAKRRWFKEKG